MLSTKELISEALHLSPAERLIITEALIKSFDVPDPSIEKAWADEAEKRLAAYKAGKLETIRFEDLFGS